jgi:hypothetical protein
MESQSGGTGAGRRAFRWTAPHPEWRTAIAWGHRVASWAIPCGDTLVLIDPLLPPAGDPHEAEVGDRLDELVGGASAVEIMITIPYHARSAEELFHRYKAATPTRIWGHKAVATRWTRDDTPLELISPSKGRPHELPAGVLAFPIGNPRRYETPLWFPAHRALAFGDAVIGYEGTLRVWQQGPFSMQWYRDKFLPTLLPLQALDAERILVTHGPPVLKGGRQALGAALATPPWDHAAVPRPAKD